MMAMDIRINLLNKILLFIFNIFCPGLGQFYYGFWKKGLFLIIAGFLLDIIFSDVFLFPFYKIPFFLIILFFSMGDGIIHLKKNDPISHFPFNRLWICLLILLFYQLPRNILGSTFYQYKISSGSMIPSVMINDFVIGERINASSIRRGDILIYQKKGNPLAIKRAVGIPKDTIKIENKELFLNNNLIGSSRTFNKILTKYQSFEFQFFKSKLGDIHFEYMKTKDPHLYNKNIGPITLGEGEYFLLGDNRDFSFDSREEKYGLLKWSEIKGRVKLIIGFNPFHLTIL